MTARRRRDLADRIDPGASLLIDTSVVLAYLVGDEPTSQAATELFDSMLATGRNRASLSMVTVSEILVRPFRRGPTAVATAEGFLQHFADIRLVPVTYDIAQEAARLRAIAELRMPDALIVASALVEGVEVIVTTDRSWRSRLAEQAPEVAIIELDQVS